MVWDCTPDTQKETKATGTFVHSLPRVVGSKFIQGSDSAFMKKHEGARQINTKKLVQHCEECLGVAGRSLQDTHSGAVGWAKTAATLGTS